MTFSNILNDDTKPQEAKDPLLNSVLAFVLETKRLSPSSIQRKFRISYNRAELLAEEVRENIPEECYYDYLKNIQHPLNNCDKSSTDGCVSLDASKVRIKPYHHIEIADYYLINCSIDVMSPMELHIFRKDGYSLSKKISDMININHNVLEQLQDSYNGFIYLDLFDLVQHFSGHHRFIHFYLKISTESFELNFTELFRSSVFCYINKILGKRKIDQLFAVITVSHDSSPDYYNLISDFLCNQLPILENGLTKFGLSLNESNDNIVVCVSMRLTQEKNMPDNTKPRNHIISAILSDNH
jgi:hypothetical protein